jgi:hypothetical protein
LALFWLCFLKVLFMAKDFLGFVFHFLGDSFFRVGGGLARNVVGRGPAWEAAI